MYRMSPKYLLTWRLECIETGDVTDTQNEELSKYLEPVKSECRIGELGLEGKGNNLCR